MHITPYRREEDHDEDYRNIFGDTSSESGAEMTTSPKLAPRASRKEGEGGAVKDKEPAERPPSPKRKLSLSSRDGLKEAKEGHPQTAGWVEDDHLGSESEKLERDKENLLSQVRTFSVQIKKAPKPPAPAPKQRFKKRPASFEEEVLMTFVERGPDREDVEMFKLAVCRMKEGDVEEAVTADVHWAYYPHNILF